MRLVFKPGVLNEVKRWKGIQSDDAMARILGVSRETYCRLRDGRSSPSAECLARIYETWNINSMLLTDFTESKTKETTAA